MRAARRVVLVAALALLAGCATPPKPSATVPDTPVNHWTGRLALQVQDKPGDSFSASFELRGSAQQGELSLSSPLAGIVGILSWRPGSATLSSASQIRHYASLDELVTQVAGSPIPVEALFDWLRGVDSPVPGWRADVSQAASGRIIAHRTSPPPEADLRVVFEPAGP